MTPTGRTWTGPTGVVFFMEFKVEIPAFDAVLHVVSLVDAQDFPFPRFLAPSPVIPMKAWPRPAAPSKASRCKARPGTSNSHRGWP
ncbi:hypothetical protein QNM99_20805 [Pseudomonas sp. PCH446]